MRIVIKIGSSSLTNSRGEIDSSKLADHVEAISVLKHAGHEVILVSSGAIAAGFKRLGYPARPVTIKGKQAAAAVGQSLLIQHYASTFASYQIVSAQLLLTRGDFTHKKRYKNAYATLSELLERSVLPIINENDTVSITELTFGDNDMLSALVAGLMHADLLIILTDVNGLYTANPSTDPTASQIKSLTEVTSSMLQSARGTGSSVGTGGMETKLQAANYAMENGINTFIGTGKGSQKLLQIVAGDGDGTYCLKNGQTVRNEKRWVALTEISGKITIDAGAYHALIKGGKSLLLPGVQAFEGHFESGEVVEVLHDNQCIGRGVIAYASDELQLKMGKNKYQLDEKAPPVIHRDQWVQL